MGLGSNRTWKKMDSLAILQKAVIELGQILAETRCASFYETEPVPKSDQNNFINTAVTGFFAGSPEELLFRIQETEAEFGRDRSMETRWGERSLDIDILLFGSLVFSSVNLVIPHPRLEERRFALEPLLELMPQACSPVTGKSYQGICALLSGQCVKKL